MGLESYFDFLAQDDVRLKGTRVGIETVLEDYLNGASPEEIGARYRSVTLEQVYATITYYLHNQREVDVYLARWRAYCDAAWQEQERNPPEIVLQCVNGCNVATDTGSPEQVAVPVALRRQLATTRCAD